MEWIIHASGLRKHYGRHLVVNGLSFEVARGECFGILGPNGAGKSTTLRMITGLSPVEEGTLHLFGLPMRPEERHIAARMGVVPQDESLDPDLSVAENLRTYGHYYRLHGAPLEARITELLHFVQLEGRGKEPVRHLSGGMKRRLVIARSLLANPELVVLDEPTTGLDPQARHLIWQRLRMLREQGLTLLLTTHYMEEAAQLCSRLLVLDQGRILDQGTPAELIRRHVEAEVVELRGEGQHGFTHPSCRLEPVGDTLYCYTQDAKPLLEQLRGQTGVTFLHRPANLEDVFLKLTGRELRD